MNITEKAAYLKGLTEGLGVDPQSKEGKLWAALNELLSDIAHEIEDLQSNQLDMADALDELTDEVTILQDLCGDLDMSKAEDDEDEGEESGEEAGRVVQGPQKPPEGVAYDEWKGIACKRRRRWL